MAWLFKSNLDAVFLLLPPSKHADSKTIEVVESDIPDSMPPFIPATAIGESESAITNIDGSKFLSMPSRVISDSLFFALLTSILPFFTFS